MTVRCRRPRARGRSRSGGASSGGERPVRAGGGFVGRSRERGVAMLPMMILMAFPILGIVLFFVLPLGIAIPLYALGVALSALTNWLMMRAMRMPVQTGRQGMIGARGRVAWWDGPTGYVRCHGEVWRARSSDGRPLSTGAEVEVVDVEPGEDMLLLVRVVIPAADDAEGRSANHRR